MQPGEFPDKVTPDTDFTDIAVVSSMWFSSSKNTFVGDGDLLMITNKCWCEYLMHCFWTQSWV